MADQRRQPLRKIKIQAQLQMFRQQIIQMAPRLRIRQTPAQIQTPLQLQAITTLIQVLRPLIFQLKIVDKNIIKKLISLINSSKYYIKNIKNYE